MCRKGVWEAYPPKVISTRELKKRRGNQCFFVEYLGQGVQYEQATKIWQQRIGRSHTGKMIMLAAISAIAAIVALFLG